MPTPKGRALSSEHRAAIAAGNRGHAVSAETRVKLAAALRGGSRSAETRAKISATLRGRVDPPEVRAKKGEDSSQGYVRLCKSHHRRMDIAAGGK